LLTKIGSFWSYPYWNKIWSFSGSNDNNVDLRRFYGCFLAMDAIAIVKTQCLNLC
jgi:hypothetical protein